MIKIRIYIFKKQSKGMLPTQSSMTMNCNLKFQIKKEKKNPTTINQIWRRLFTNTSCLLPV